MAITVRPFETRDTDQAKKILLEDADQPDQAFELGWKGHPPTFPFFVAADENGTVHGIVEGRFDSRYSERLRLREYTAPQGWIYTLAVRADERREGTGTALIRHFVETAQSKGCGFVAFTVDESDDNQSIEGRMRFFQACGFHILVDDDRGSAMGAPVTDVLRALTAV
ncbi:GNAT family N-acetyltransferase [Rhodococcus hoagii]|nr:GNAT family N-acetyltransferase [Prescottella equi]